MTRLFGQVVTRIEETLIGVLILSGTLVLFVNVVARYVFNSGFSWAEELVRYEIVWMVFLGASVAARKGIHISVDVVMTVLKGRIKGLVAVLIETISAVFAAVLCILGIEVVAGAAEFGQLTPALQIPQWWVQLVIPLGGFLMAVRFGQRAWKRIPTIFGAPLEVEEKQAQ